MRILCALSPLHPLNYSGDDAFMDSDNCLLLYFDCVPDLLVLVGHRST